MDFEIAEIAKQVTSTLGPYLKPLLDKGKAALEKTVLSLIDCS